VAVAAAEGSPGGRAWPRRAPASRPGASPPASRGWTTWHRSGRPGRAARSPPAPPDRPGEEHRPARPAHRQMVAVRQDTHGGVPGVAVRREEEIGALLRRPGRRERGQERHDRQRQPRRPCQRERLPGAQASAMAVVAVDGDSVGDDRRSRHRSHQEHARAGRRIGRASVQQRQWRNRYQMRRQAQRAIAYEERQGRRPRSCIKVGRERRYEAVDARDRRRGGVIGLEPAGLYLVHLPGSSGASGHMPRPPKRLRVLTGRPYPTNSLVTRRGTYTGLAVAPPLRRPPLRGGAGGVASRPNRACTAACQTATSPRPTA